MSTLVHEEEILNLNLKIKIKFKISKNILFFWTSADIFEHSGWSHF